MIETFHNIGIFTFGVMFLFVFCTCWFVIRYDGIAKFTAGRSEDVAATQAMHKVPTVRIGGLIVILAFAIGMAFSWQKIGSDLAFALGAGLFVFVAGAREDLLRDVSPLIRLISAFFSGGAALFLSSTMVTGFGLPDLDWIFGTVSVAIIVTLVWSAGFCHALNLIDGLNGLASSYAIMALLALGTIASLYGQADIVFAALLLSAALCGFLVLNWPFGKIFLGDAGAYAIGHIIAWLGIVLMSRVPTLSGFAILLILFWPVADTLFTIVRRKLRNHPTDQPDRLHFHHLVARSLGILFRQNNTRGGINALATLVLFPFFLCPIIAGVVFATQPVKALVALLFFAFLFVVSYVFARDYFSQRRFHKGFDKSFVPVFAPEKPNTELSPLSGIFIQNSLAVDVRIETDKDSDLWTLRTIAHQARGKEWAILFPSDRAAWDHFLKTIQDDGMETAVGMELRPMLI